jgi:hypothetical protein
MKDKTKFENAASTVFAPQHVGLVTTIDRANQPNGDLRLDNEHLARS